MPRSSLFLCSAVAPHMFPLACTQCFHSDHSMAALCKLFKNQASQLRFENPGARCEFLPSWVRFNGKPLQQCQMKEETVAGGMCGGDHSKPVKPGSHCQLDCHRLAGPKDYLQMLPVSYLRGEQSLLHIQKICRLLKMINLQKTSSAFFHSLAPVENVLWQLWHMFSG